MKVKVRAKEHQVRSVQAIDKGRRRSTPEPQGSGAGDGRGRGKGDAEREAGRGRGGRGTLLSAVPELLGAGSADAVAQDDAEHDSPVQPELHAGLLLRRAREQRGLSVQDIAKKTRIVDRWIIIIEEARLDQLPAPVFAIGYVRNYARAVGLDADDIVERFRALGRQGHGSFWESLSEKAQPAQRSPEQVAAQRKYMLWTAAFLLLGLAALLAVWLRNRH